MNWQSKKFNIGKPDARIELRKKFKFGDQTTAILVIVALDGWDLSSKNEKREPTSNSLVFNTKGLNVRLSMNGPLLMTLSSFYEIMEEINEVVKKSYTELKDIDNLTVYDDLICLE